MVVDYYNLQYRSSGNEASAAILGELQTGFRPYPIISKASAAVDIQVKSNDRNGPSLGRIAQKPTDLKHWVPGTMQVMCWVGSSSSGKGAIRKQIMKRKQGV